MQNIVLHDTQTQNNTLAQDQTHTKKSTETKTYSRFALPGFSIMEMMLVIGIIGFLIAFILPQVNRYRLQSNIKQTKLTLKTLSGAIDQYHADTDQYPSTLNDLIKKPADVKGWISPYIADKKHPVDSWKNKLVYNVSPEGSEHPYELYSYGPKGKKTPKKDWINVWDK